MKKILPLFPAAIALLSIASCTKYIYVSRSSVPQSPVVADGNATEWPVPLNFYDEKSKLQYAVSNDNENLYICIKATEDETQTKIFRSGLQVWIDTTANNEHQVGLAFPLSSDIRRGDQEGDVHRSMQRNDGSDHSKKHFLNDFIEMDLTGFKSPIGGMTSVQNPYGIKASLNKDSIGIMTYEAVIPFRTFLHKDVLTPSDSMKMLGITIVLKAVPSGEMQRSGGGGGHMAGGGGGGGMGGGMGGMGGGGMRGGGMHGGGGGGGHHGGGGSGGGAGSEYLHETNSIKKIFRLAVNTKYK